MFKGQKVKIRLKRTMPEQKERILVGTVLNMDSDWVKVEGKFYYLVKGKLAPKVDKQPRVLCIPRENISVTRILPQDLDLDELEYTIEDNKMVIRVGDGQPISISE